MPKQTHHTLLFLCYVLVSQQWETYRMRCVQAHLVQDCMLHGAEKKNITLTDAKSIVQQQGETGMDLSVVNTARIL